MVAIVTRAQWGARFPVPAGRHVAPSARRWFVVHWPGGAAAADEAQMVRNIESWHRNGNGWAVIGYNFLVGRSGRIFEGCGRDIRGIHEASRNTDGWGVCVMVSPGETVPAAALNATRALYAHLNSVAGRTLSRGFHGQFFSTACAGPALNQWVRNGMPAAGGGAPLPPPPVGGAPAFPGRILRQPPIMRGTDVTQVQTRLRARGGTLAADGAYGPITEGFVRRAQTIGRVGVDGRVGPVTWPVLWRDSASVAAAAPPPPPARPAFPGRIMINTRPMQSGNDIRAWQQQMRTRWGRTITVDGWYGPQSEHVCRWFQAKCRIGVDGRVGPITWGRSFP